MRPPSWHVANAAAFRDEALVSATPHLTIGGVAHKRTGETSRSLHFASFVHDLVSSFGGTCTGVLGCCFARPGRKCNPRHRRKRNSMLRCGMPCIGRAPNRSTGEVRWPTRPKAFAISTLATCRRHVRTSHWESRTCRGRGHDGFEAQAARSGMSPASCPCICGQYLRPSRSAHFAGRAVWRSAQGWHAHIEQGVAPTGSGRP